MNTYETLLSHSSMEPGSVSDTILSISGVIETQRKSPRLCFADLTYTSSGNQHTIQLMLSRNLGLGIPGLHSLTTWYEEVVTDDLVDVTGQVIMSNHGVLSIAVQDWSFTQ
jgi:lysyl-tRNA synthetase class II